MSSPGNRCVGPLGQMFNDPRRFRASSWEFSIQRKNDLGQPGDTLPTDGREILP